MTDRASGRAGTTATGDGTTPSAAPAAAAAAPPAATPVDSEDAFGPDTNVFVTCERSRARGWLAHAPGTEAPQLPVVRLAGYRAYIVEQWVFDQHLPCVAVVLNNSPTETVCPPTRRPACQTSTATTTAA